MHASTISAPPAVVAQSATAAPSAPASAPPASPSPNASPDPALTARAQAELIAWRGGKIDRRNYSDVMNAKLTDDVVAGVAAQLAPLGKVRSFAFAREAKVQTFDVYEYRASLEKGDLIETIVYDTSGKIAGLFFKPAPAP